MKKVLSLAFILFTSMFVKAEDLTGYDFIYGDSTTQPGYHVARARGQYGYSYPVLQGDILNGIYGGGYTGTGFTFTNNSSVELRASENWTPTNNGASVVFKITPAGSTTPSDFLTYKGGSLDVFSTTATFGVADGEQQLYKFDGTTNSTSTTQLSSTIWAYMHANSSGTVTTAHEGAIFGRAIKGTLSQTFSFGVEGNCWSNTILGGGVSTTGSCVGVIGHSVWEGALASTPTAPVIGGDFRSEITDPAIATNRTGNDLQFDIIGVRSEVYGGITNSTSTRNYSFYGVTAGSKIVNNGPIMAVPPAVQTIAGGDTVKADACGTVKQINSAGAVTTDLVTTFSVPSISTAGTANTGCFMWLVNTGANTITLDNNSTFLTYAGEDINLNTAAAVPVFGNGSNWVQAGPIVNTSLAAVYLSSVTAVANTAATTVFGNAGTVTLTPGDWDVSGACEVSLNGSVTTALSVALSANTGNTTTDHVTGDNQLQALPPTAASDVSVTIPAWRKAVASSTPIFIKVKATFSAGNPQTACRISARRIN